MLMNGDLDLRFVPLAVRDQLPGIHYIPFQEAGFQPRVLFETASNRTLRAMASHGIASTILPASYAADEDQIAYFYPISRPVWRMYGCFRKNFCLTRGAKTFLAMAQEHFTKDSSFQTSPSPCIM